MTLNLEREVYQIIAVQYKVWTTIFFWYFDNFKHGIMVLAQFCARHCGFRHTQSPPPFGKP